jgi:thiamine pyrophosphokinase
VVGTEAEKFDLDAVLLTEFGGRVDHLVAHHAVITNENESFFPWFSLLQHKTRLGYKMPQTEGSVVRVVLRVFHSRHVST